MTPPTGPISPHNGPFVRNAQEIAPGLFLVEAQNGLKGSGKVWRQTIIKHVPHFDPNAVAWDDRFEYREVATVKRATGRRAAQWKAQLWKQSINLYLNIYVEGHFDTEMDAVEFMLLNAKEMFK